MIRKSGSRFSLATNAERVCAEIMLKKIKAQNEHLNIGKASVVHIDIIEDLPSLARLEDNWNAVYDADDEAQIFLSWKFINAAVLAAIQPVSTSAGNRRNGRGAPDRATAGQHSI